MWRLDLLSFDELEETGDRLVSVIDGEPGDTLPSPIAFSKMSIREFWGNREILQDWECKSWTHPLNVLVP